MYVRWDEYTGYRFDGHTAEEIALALGRHAALLVQPWVRDETGRVVVPALVRLTEEDAKEAVAAATSMTNGGIRVERIGAVPLRVILRQGQAPITDLYDELHGKGQGGLALRLLLTPKDTLPPHNPNPITEAERARLHEHLGELETLAHDVCGDPALLGRLLELRGDLDTASTGRGQHLADDMRERIRAMTTEVMFAVDSVDKSAIIVLDGSISPAQFLAQLAAEAGHSELPDDPGAAISLANRPEDHN